MDVQIYKKNHRYVTTAREVVVMCCVIEWLERLSSRLESVYTPKVYRGFESPSLRSFDAPGGAKEWAKNGPKGRKKVTEKSQ